jgi:hypothetical protein
MERALERCGACAQGVLSPRVSACPDRGRAQHVETFGTTAAALLALRDWLEVHGCRRTRKKAGIRTG